MTSNHKLFQKLKRLLGLFGPVIGVNAIFMAVALVLNIAKNIPITQLTKDPNALCRLPAYSGFLSQAGILCWTAAAVICLFSAQVLSGTIYHRYRNFLLYSGSLMLLLDLDDAFQLHEAVFPKLGIPQNLVLVGYMAFGIFYILRFLRLIVETDYAGLIGMAFLCFGISVFLDVFQPSLDQLWLLKDGTKLFGILSFVAYFFNVGRDLVRRALLHVPLHSLQPESEESH